MNEKMQALAMKAYEHRSQRRSYIGNAHHETQAAFREVEQGKSFDLPSSVRWGVNSMSQAAVSMHRAEAHEMACEAYLYAAEIAFGKEGRKEVEAEVERLMVEGPY